MANQPVFADCPTCGRMPTYFDRRCQQRMFRKHAGPDGRTDCDWSEHLVPSNQPPEEPWPPSLFLGRSYLKGVRIPARVDANPISSPKTS